jgi:hypothetical protein
VVIPCKVSISVIKSISPSQEIVENRVSVL